MSNPPRRRRLARGLALLFLLIASPAGARGDGPSVSHRSRDHADGQEIRLDWPIDDAETGRLEIDTRPGRPLIHRLALVQRGAEEPATVLTDVDPVFFVTVGSRVAPGGRPPGMSPFNTFFDSPAKRPHQSYRAQVQPRRTRLLDRGSRASLIVAEMTAGPFGGELWFNVYRGSRLVHVEAVLSTREADRAFLYDAGLCAPSPSWRRLGRVDPEGRHRHQDMDPMTADQPVAVRHRAIVAESEGGAVSCFPPPHQFFFARDYTSNLKTAWFGRDHRGLDDRPGFGIRQAETGGGNFSPWYNAPPGTEQRLGVFFLLARGGAEQALTETLRYTRGDRFPELPGMRTFTSHWHMALTVAAMREQARGAGRTVPDAVGMFKDMGVNLVHLAEFHGDGHQFDPGPLRMPELDAMFAECRRLSDDSLLFLPGEEVAGILDVSRPGKGDAHWMYLFPRPVYLTLRRGPGQPFEEEDPARGKVYHVGGRDDMARLLRLERGLAWTSHPRIKASSWTPDALRGEPFFEADSWLGAAWKAMPADLSQPRLGSRALDLLDDMGNWGLRKQLPGEVDVFTLDHTHELYGHMNVNYLRLERLPRFDEGWGVVLDALRGGRFFTTTGEVLIREFTVGGKSSGDSVAIAEADDPEVRLTLEWTFPPRFAEIVSGDGRTVHRERVELDAEGPFGSRTLRLHPRLRGRTWVRAEAWDVACNGSFTQPVWIGKAE